MVADARPRFVARDRRQRVVAPARARIGLGQHRPHLGA
jgi:hypothetical protein